MNTKQISAMVAIVAVILVFANASTAFAATSLATIDTFNIKKYKGQYFKIFEVCAGEQALNDAVVIVSSDMATRSVSLDKIAPNKCSLFSVQLPAMDVASIQVDFETIKVSEPTENTFVKTTRSSEPTIELSQIHKMRSGQPGGMETVRVIFKITAGDSTLRDFTVSLDSQVDSFEQTIKSLAAHKSTVQTVFMKVGNTDSVSVNLNQ